MNDRLTFTFSRRFNGSFLFCLFCLAYVATPYWMLPHSILMRAVSLLATLSLGILWISAANQPINWNIRISENLFLLLFFIGLLIWNFPSLTSAIPMRGDEDYHIQVVLLFLNDFMPHIHIHLPFILIALVFLYAAKKKSSYTIPLGVIVCGYFIIFGTLNPIFPQRILRYPFSSKYLQSFFPFIGNLFGMLYQELLFRIIPFFSVVAITWLSAVSIRNRKTIDILLIGTAVGTMPLVSYYSSILYLEMPMIFLMLVVCLKSKDLLDQNWEMLSKQPAWIALIFMGFIKETAIPFLFVFTGFRLCLQIQQHHKQVKLPSLLIQEGRIFFYTFLPAGIYLFYRFIYGTTRKTAFELGNLFHLQAYSTAFSSFPEQFGLFCILFPAGCFLMARNKAMASLLFLLATMTAYFLFFLLDNPEYAGYSRFNLYLLPMLLCICSNLFSHIRHQKIIFIPLCLLVFLSNILLSPIHMDGTKKPNWGNGRSNTSEHYYPYRKALEWLRDHHPTKRMVFSGLDYTYFFPFYFNKLSWFPIHGVHESKFKNNPNQSLYDAITVADKAHFDLVVFQLPHEKVPTPTQARGYELIQVIRNQAHAVAIFQKNRLLK